MHRFLSYLDNRLRTGHTKINRLCFIAKFSPALRIEALTLALDAVKKTTLDSQRYLTICADLSEACRQQDRHDYPVVDMEWVEKVQKERSKKTESLESDLRIYKSNLIKESIRVSKSFFYLPA